MTLREFQSAAMEFSPEGHDRIHYGCLGLMGECGEVVDVVKKQRFGFHRRIDSEAMQEELGDVMWYLAELATGLGIDLAAEMDSRRFQTTNYRRESVERYAVTMASLSYKCYSNGYIHNDKKLLITGMRKIYSCAKMIALIDSIPMNTILEGNIRKLKRRYPHGCG